MQAYRLKELQGVFTISGGGGGGKLNSVHFFFFFL